MGARVDLLLTDARGTLLSVKCSRYLCGKITNALQVGYLLQLVTSANKKAAVGV